jgi:DNA (cytosine-5)-methyltransferase 1
MKVLDLFSGIGGFSLGLEAAGMTTVAFCERDPYCRQILARHWPSVPIHEDITELDAHGYYGSVDVVCGGFPCQPFSVAGKQRGAEDDRALWPEMLRVIQQVAPSYVIGENVTGIISMELDNVLSDLEGAGYTTETFVLPACAVDAQHRRDRVWVLAYANRKSEPDGSVNEQRLVADADRSQTQRWSDTRNAESVGTRSNEQPQRRANNREPAIWRPEPSICRVLDGVPNRTHRLRALGNAVVPQLVQAIGELVIEHDAR